MYAIETKHISLKVNEFQLQDISIRIPHQQVTSIIGPNGSGKSTLLKIISRILKSDEGTIYIEQKETTKYRTKEFAKKMTMLLQSKDHLPNLTVKELISYGRTPYKSFFKQHLTEEDEEIISNALQITNTMKHKNRLFHTLSGGEQQKVRIAMALAQQTDILLLDEPTTYLDIAHQYDVMELLYEINQSYGITIVMVLHELQQAAIYSDFLIALKKGQIVDSGPPEEILTETFLKRVYDFEANIQNEHGYPLIIPKIRRKK